MQFRDHRLSESQSRSGQPGYEIADRLSRTSADWNVLVVPHLYDLNPEGPLSELRSRFRPSDRLRLALSRARRIGSCTAMGLRQTRAQPTESELRRRRLIEKTAKAAAGQDGERIERVMDTRPWPSRSIYCIDLRACESPERVSQESERIRAELGGRSVAPSDGRFRGQRLAAVAADRRADRAALVSGDRLQPLHELHGVHRLLPVRRLRNRPVRDDSGRAARQLPQRLSGVQPGLPGERHHLPPAQSRRPSPVRPEPRWSEDRSVPVVRKPIVRNWRRCPIDSMSAIIMGKADHRLPIRH
jgi:hypothetical protein